MGRTQRSASHGLLHKACRVAHSSEAHPLTAVLSEFHPPDDLLINEVCGNVVLGRVVPGAEDLLPEEQPPGSIPLLGALLLCVLLTLRDGVHDVIVTAAQRRHLMNTYLQLNNSMRSEQTN